MNQRTFMLLNQRGVAAVELAIIMMMMAMLLPVTMYISRLLWNHLVLLHATHAAATTIASLSIAETSGSDATTTLDSSRGLVREATDAALIEPLFSDPIATCTPAFQCASLNRGTVSVDAFARVTEYHFSDPIFVYDSPDASMYLRVVSTVPYANRALAH